MKKVYLDLVLLVFGAAASAQTRNAGSHYTLYGRADPPHNYKKYRPEVFDRSKIDLEPSSPGEDGHRNR